MIELPSGSANRREFLVALAACGAITALGRSAHAQTGSKDQAEPATKLVEDPERPQYHLLPARNWMNDPNGPIYVNGKYHMFFQYNPHAATWGDMSWNHAVSSDMLHWTHLPLALVPTPDSADSYGVFSGSAIQVGKRVYAVYTGVKNSTPDLATIRDGTDKIQESQCLAWSDDPNLVSWTKETRPIVPLPPSGMAITGFRDPSAWKQGEWFYMTVGSGIAKVGGCVLLYRSKDLKSWEYLHKLVEGTWNGKPTTNPCDDGEMWECPEFFALDGGHVLIYSTLGKVFWQSGVLDMATLKFKGSKTGLLDLDAFYAPKTQLDSRGRRILWGWIPERRSQDAMREAGWSGMMSLPRVMNLDHDGTLRLQVLPQATVLRSHAFAASVTGDATTLTLARANGELLCTGVKGKDFEMTMTDGATELLRVRYSAERHSLIANENETRLQPGDVPTLHAFVDGSVIETILGDRIGYTKRFYYSQQMAPDVQVRISGGAKAKAWAITSISPNRLTTPSLA